ncbi:hypothetical protein TPHA_0C01910 [Tetrapisispora phaffii CBS 4417]|uniref:Uncharacterized protein n=1 Tax=Tetrapisispora phaffii (strain ATCC 24235 / CBS 4417 / NBRC 1672 / NRRL Y-8282 / UCD 70-5) TaxID=1071381 RepID=G8BRH0_TETPH|nr:hypothetical protein TPHA_0C01910 [Tetrapisispora phaffii CBS 4417]CCE62346.1 hypothetical protein TPHA_0C01910 [Tetrapisispora phaffii CBS 4417]
MLKSYDTSKPKRKSFFFFGSNNENIIKLDNPNDKKNTKQMKVASKNKINPLSKEPLRNQPVSSSPFDQIDNTNNKREVEKIAVSSIANSESNEKHNPFRTNASSNVIIPANTDISKELLRPSGTVLGRRPLPPKLDMRNISKSATLRSNINNKSETKKKFEPDNDNDIGVITNVESLNECLGDENKHRRQRSEAEKLVDDIDDFLAKHKGRSASPSPGIDIDIYSDHAVSPIGALSLDADGIMKFKDSNSNPFQEYNDKDFVEERENSKHHDTLSKRSTLISTATTTESDNFSFAKTIAASSETTQPIQINDTTAANTDMPNLVYKHDTFNMVSSNDNQGYNSFIASDIDISSDESDFANRSVTYSANHNNFNNSNKSTEEIKNYQKLPNNYSTDGFSVSSEKKVFRVVNDEKVNFNFHSDSESESESESDSNFTYGNDPTPSNFSQTQVQSKDENKNESLYLSDQQVSVIDKSSHYTGNSEYVYPEEVINNISKISKVDKDLNEISYNAENLSSNAELLSGGVIKPDSINKSLDIESATSSLNHDQIGEVASSSALEDKSLGSPSYMSNKYISSVKREGNVSLVSGYVEEVRLKYIKTANFLQAPPNLPISLKQKNNVIRPQNMKVRIRTSSKQVGIKHGKIKSKLLSLETISDEAKANKIETNLVDHTKEFHNLMNKKDQIPEQSDEDSDNDVESYLKDIPGDNAYNSDDIFEPLREKKDNNNDLARSNTTTSYYTKAQQRRKRTGTLDNNYSNLHDLPTDININDYLENEIEKVEDIKDDDMPLEPYISVGGLHITNPDTDSD